MKLKPILANVGRKGEMRPVILALGYSMSLFKISTIYQDILLRNCPELYFSWNNRIGYPEGAD